MEGLVCALDSDPEKVGVIEDMNSVEEIMVVEDGGLDKVLC